jgi:hypothetical protein
MEFHAVNARDGGGGAESNLLAVNHDFLHDPH